MAINHYINIISIYTNNINILILIINQDIAYMNFYENYNNVLSIDPERFK